MAFSIPLRAGPAPRMELREESISEAQLPVVDIQGDADSLRVVENYQDDQFASLAINQDRGSSRRQAVTSAARLVPGLVLLPQIAHADAIADIAARENAVAIKSKDAKALAKAQAEVPGFLDQATGVVAPAIGLSIIGGIAFFGSQLVGQSGIVGDVADNLKEKRRPLTAAEKRKYKGMSAKEKRDLGIKGI